jgi:hypothetical protein
MRIRGPQGTRGRSPAATLLELIIVMALMGLLLGAVGYMMRYAHDYYFGTLESLDLQQQSLFGISRLSGDLTDSNFTTVRRYDDPLPTDPPGRPNSGLVVPSPRDLAGAYQFDDAGRIKWTTFVCYYVENIPGGRKALVKKVTPVPSGPQLSPPDPDLEGRDLAYFKGSPDPKQIIATGVTRFETTLNADTITTLINSRVSGHYEFELETQTTILPRN